MSPVNERAGDECQANERAYGSAVHADGNGHGAQNFLLNNCPQTSFFLIE